MAWMPAFIYCPPSISYDIEGRIIGAVVVMFLLFYLEEDVISFDDAAQRDQNQKMFPNRYPSSRDLLFFSPTAR
jgi:hypothetical protein